MEVVKQERTSNIELFRIVLMILLVASHYVHNSGILEELYIAEASIEKTFVMAVFGMWGKPAINGFVFITGYFMCKKTITSMKFIKLLCQVVFYNIVIYTIFVLFGYVDFSIVDLISNVNPVQSVGVNFVSCYLVFYLLIPFVNILISNMTEKQHKLLICILGAVYIILGTVPRYEVIMNYLSWFLFVYLFAAYFRIYKDDILKKKRLWIIMLILSVCAAIGSVFIGLYASRTFNMKLIYYFLEDSNKIVGFVMSFSAFVVFLNLNIKQSTTINNFAKATFGVLLIHANSDIMRTWLWCDTLRCVEFYYSDYYLFHATLSVIIVYIVCTIIELLRCKFIEKAFLSLISKRGK